MTKCQHWTNLNPPVAGCLVVNSDRPVRESIAKATAVHGAKCCNSLVGKRERGDRERKYMNQAGHICFCIFKYQRTDYTPSLSYELYINWNLTVSLLYGALNIEITIFKTQFNMTKGLVGFPHTSCIANVNMQFSQDCRIALKLCSLIKYLLPQSAAQLLIGFLWSSVLIHCHQKPAPHTQHSLNLQDLRMPRSSTWHGLGKP